MKQLEEFQPSVSIPTLVMAFVLGACTAGQRMRVPPPELPGRLTVSPGQGLASFFFPMSRAANREKHLGRSS